MDFIEQAMQQYLKRQAERWLVRAIWFNGHSALCLCPDCKWKNEKFDQNC